MSPERKSLSDYKVRKKFKCQTFVHVIYSHYNVLPFHLIKVLNGRAVVIGCKCHSYFQYYGNKV